MWALSIIDAYLPFYKESSKFTFETQGFWNQASPYYFEDLSVSPRKAGLPG